LATADLAESRFNTIVAFFDENMNQVACNDDINSNQQQSRITDYAMTKGQKIYIRVSDIGGFGGTSYHESGVVIMDFTFSAPVGTEDDYQTISISPPYPNPASAATSFDLEVQKPGNIMITIQDVMGKNILEQHAKYSTGKHTVTLDATALRPGTYMVRVEGLGKHETRKLIITR
jgi:hypothetical protein